MVGERAPIHHDAGGPVRLLVSDADDAGDPHGPEGPRAGFGRNVDRLVAAYSQNVSREPPPPMFTPYQLRGLKLSNRIAVSPMCMYSATNGTVGDFHLVHLESRAIGGAGLVFTEMTDVSPEGRISPYCAGMYSTEHVGAWKRVVDFIHANSDSKVGVQLAHSGPKGSLTRSWEGHHPLGEKDGWQIIAPSPIPFMAGRQTPKEMTRNDMVRVRDAFVQATRMSNDAGFDIIELHMAHGYLLSSFISPVRNHRVDEYGGLLEPNAIPARGVPSRTERMAQRETDQHPHIGHGLA